MGKAESSRLVQQMIFFPDSEALIKDVFVEAVHYRYPLNVRDDIIDLYFF